MKRLSSYYFSSLSFRILFYPSSDYSKIESKSISIDRSSITFGMLLACSFDLCLQSKFIRLHYVSSIPSVYSSFIENVTLVENEFTA